MARSAEAPPGRRVGLLAALVLALVARPLHAAEPGLSHPYIEGPDGQVLARGEHVEHEDGGRLEAHTTYAFEDGRSVEESLTLTTTPFAQQSYSWVETREGVTLRRFKVDFQTGEARAFVDESGEARHWDLQVKPRPGRIFAGSGFVFAVQQIRKEVPLGDEAWAEAVAFTPQPRVATVRITGERATIQLNGAEHAAERWVIHPEIGVLNLFVDAPDFVLWLDPQTGALLAFEGPLATPSDPTVRIYAER